VQPIVGWTLALALLAVGATTYGWRGAILAISVIAFWLLLQFNRVVRVMRRAADSPLGMVDSAVMFNAKLERGLTLMKVVQLAGSLGRKVGESPETWAWRDAGDATVTIVMAGAKVDRWSLARPDERPSAEAAPEAAPAERAE
jgi:hypothetical protein